MAKKWRAKQGILLLRGLARFLVLITALGMIRTSGASVQLVLLPVILGFLVARYVFQTPVLRAAAFLKGRVSPTFSRTVGSFALARERAVLGLRRPPNLAWVALAMILVTVLVPFSWSEFGGVCSRREPIRVAFRISSPDEPVHWVVMYVIALMSVISFVLLEELAFRGWLLSPLRKLIGTVGAVAVTSYFFAVIHLRPATGYNDLFNGVIFGVSAVLTGSIWTPVALHFAYNGGVWAWDRFFDRYGAGAISCGFARPAFLTLAATLVLVLWLARQRPGGGAAARAFKRR
ncbi:MAG: CPBP family intramembrane glutamic endopeptidase [Gemmatimonadaceae bacterium]